MNSTELKGNWNIIKGKLKKKYGELTDDDLAYVAGAEKEMFGRLQAKLGRTKEELLKSIESEKITF